LDPLVGIEDLGPTVSPEGTFKCGNTETAIHCHRDLPGEHKPAIPIHYCRQVNKATWKWDIGYVGTPYLIRADDIQLSQQIWISLMVGMGQAGVGLRCY
jgi:hypothetical protein